MRSLTWSETSTCEIWVSVEGTTFEPPHDETNKMTVRPAKTQISLAISNNIRSNGKKAWKIAGESDPCLIWFVTTMLLFVIYDEKKSDRDLIFQQFFRLSCHWNVYCYLWCRWEKLLPILSFFLPLVLLPLVQFSNQKQEFLPMVHSCLWCCNTPAWNSQRYKLL